MNENGFEEFHWRGQKRYRCNRIQESGDPCEFDTHDVEALKKHAAEPHNRSGKSPVATRRQLSLFDASGDPLVYEEPVPEEFGGVSFREE